MRTISRLTLSAIVVAAACAASCTTTTVTRPAEVPPHAVLVGGGTMVVDYVIPENGTLYLIDGNDGQLLSTRTTRAGDVISLDLEDEQLRNRLLGAKAQRMPASYRPQLLAYFAPDFGIVPKGARPLGEAGDSVIVPSDGTAYVVDDQGRVVWTGPVRLGDRTPGREGYQFYFLEGPPPLSPRGSDPGSGDVRKPLIPLGAPFLEPESRNP